MRALFYRRQILYLASLVCFSLLLWLIKAGLNSVSSHSHPHVHNKQLDAKGKRSESDELFSIENIPTVGKLTLAVVSCGGRIEEAVTMLKSAVLFSQGIALHVVAFVDEETRSNFTTSIEKLAQSAKEVKQPFEFEIHNTWFPPENEDVWKKLYAPCSTQRIFFPSQLPNIDSILYMDSDTVFISDVKKLWDHFDKMNETQWIAAANEDEPTGDGWYNTKAKVPYYGKRGLNTGVALLNLTRMRNAQVEKKAKVIQEKYSKDLAWGDQDIFNAMFNEHPEFVYEIPCSFNFRTSHCKCIYDGDCRCRSAEIEGVHVVHGNRQAFKNDEHLFFKRIYEAIKEHSLVRHSLKRLCKELKGIHSEFFYGRGPACVKNSQLFFKQICDHSN